MIQDKRCHTLHSVPCGLLFFSCQLVFVSVGHSCQTALTSSVSHSAFQLHPSRYVSSPLLCTHLWWLPLNCFGTSLVVSCSLIYVNCCFMSHVSRRHWMFLVSSFISVSYCLLPVFLMLVALVLLLDYLDLVLWTLNLVFITCSPLVIKYLFASTAQCDKKSSCS